jgi:hypothetical protein
MKTIDILSCDIMLLPGFQKGRDIKDCLGKGSEQFWPKRAVCVVVARKNVKK